MKAKFKSAQEYHGWCEDMVRKIYYAQIAMNNESIREVVSEIGMRLWLPEGCELIGDATATPRSSAGDGARDVEDAYRRGFEDGAYCFSEDANPAKYVDHKLSIYLLDLALSAGKPAMQPRTEPGATEDDVRDFDNEEGAK